jgi:hypothetical protein
MRFLAGEFAQVGCGGLAQSFRPGQKQFHPQGGVWHLPDFVE